MDHGYKGQCSCCRDFQFTCRVVGTERGPIIYFYDERTPTITYKALNGKAFLREVYDEA